MNEENQIKCTKSGLPKNDKVKMRIIELVLDAPRTVQERNVVTYLIDSETIKCQSSVNRHCNDLYNMGCLDKIGSKRSINLNKWNIKNTKNLKNISLKFPEIKLNTYEKALNILYKELNLDFQKINDLKIYILLRLSRSFFNMCITTDSETFLDRVWKIYKLNREFPYHPITDRQKVNYNEKGNGNSPEFTKVTATFRKILLELPDNIPKNTRELYCSFMKNVEEKINESTSDDKVIKSLNSLFTEYISTVHTGYLNLLFNHFFSQDILLGYVEPEEIKFMSEYTENLTTMLEIENKNLSLGELKAWMLKDLQLMSNVIFYCKMSIFGVFNNCYEVFESLKKKYKEDLDLYNEIENEYDILKNEFEALKPS